MKSKTCKCKRRSRNGRKYHNTQRGGRVGYNFFPRYKVNYTTAKLARGAITDNSGLAAGILGRTITAYLLQNKMKPNIVPPIKTFKPYPVKYAHNWDNFMKPVQVFKPKINIQDTSQWVSPTVSVSDLAIHSRDSNSNSNSNSHSRHSSRHSHSRHSHSRNSNRAPRYNP